MKRTTIFLILLVVLSLAAQAQNLSVSFDAKNATSSRSQNSTFKDGYGGDISDFERERTVEITLRGIGAGQMNVEVKVWWIGKPLAGGDKLLLSSNTVTKEVTASKGLTWKESSGAVAGHDMKLPLIGVRRTSGNKILGWVVGMKTPGAQVYNYKSSDPSLVEFVRNLK